MSLPKRLALTLAFVAIHCLAVVLASRIVTTSYHGAIFHPSLYISEKVIPDVGSVSLCAAQFQASAGRHQGFWHDPATEECQLGTLDLPAVPEANGVSGHRFYGRASPDLTLMFAANGDNVDPGWKISGQDGLICMNHSLEEMPFELYAPVVMTKESFKLYSCGGQAHDYAETGTYALVPFK